MSDLQRISDRYHLDRLVHASDAASVFRVTDPQSGQTAVLKLVQGRSGFLDACRALQASSHPCLPRVFDFGYSSAGAYLVTEQLSGATFDLFTGSPPARVLPLLLPVLDAIEELDRHGLAHRNLRADNLLVVPQGDAEQIKILGWGQATAGTGESGRSADLRAFAEIACAVIGAQVQREPAIVVSLPDASGEGIADASELAILLSILLQPGCAMPASLFSELRRAFGQALHGDAGAAAGGELDEAEALRADITMAVPHERLFGPLRGRSPAPAPPADPPAPPTDPPAPPAVPPALADPVRVPSQAPPGAPARTSVRAQPAAAARRSAAGSGELRTDTLPAFRLEDLAPRRPEPTPEPAGAEPAIVAEPSGADLDLSGTRPSGIAPPAEKPQRLPRSRPARGASDATAPVRLQDTRAPRPGDAWLETQTAYVPPPAASAVPAAPAADPSEGTRTGLAAPAAAAAAAPSPAAAGPNAAPGPALDVPTAQQAWATAGTNAAPGTAPEVMDSAPAPSAASLDAVADTATDVTIAAPARPAPRPNSAPGAAPASSVTAPARAAAGSDGAPGGAPATPQSAPARAALSPSDGARNPADTTLALATAGMTAALEAAASAGMPGPAAVGAPAPGAAAGSSAAAPGPAAGSSAAKTGAAAGSSAAAPAPAGVEPGVSPEMKTAVISPAVRAAAGGAILPFQPSASAEPAATAPEATEQTFARPRPAGRRSATAATLISQLISPAKSPPPRRPAAPDGGAIEPADVVRPATHPAPAAPAVRPAGGGPEPLGSQPLPPAAQGQPLPLPAQAIPLKPAAPSHAPGSSDTPAVPALESGTAPTDATSPAQGSPLTPAAASYAHGSSNTPAVPALESGTAPTDAPSPAPGSPMVPADAPYAPGSAAPVAMSNLRSGAAPSHATSPAPAIPLTPAAASYTPGSFAAPAVPDLAPAASPPQFAPAAAPPPQAAPRQEAVRRGTPGRGGLLAAVGAAAVLLVLAVVVVTAMRRTAPPSAAKPATAAASQAAGSAGLAAPTAAGPAAPAAAIPAPVAEPALEPRLKAIEDLLANGDTDGARRALSQIGPAEQAALGPADREAFQRLAEQAAAGRRAEIARGLAAGLRRGDIHRLGAALAAAQGVGDLPAPLRRDLDRARQAVDLDTQLAQLDRAPDPPAQLRKATDLLALVPRYAHAAELREQAAKAIEDQAAAALAAGETDRAAALVAALRQAWPERPGLQERADAVEAQHRSDEHLESVLAAAARQEAAGQPLQGLETLAAATPGAHFRDRFRQQREKLNQLLAKLDAAPPAIALRGGYKPEYDKGAQIAVPLRITDDLAVKSAECWVRAEGDATYRPVPVRHLSGADYEVDISPDLHQNRTLEMYAAATDNSGHQTLLGSRDKPLKIKRRNWLEKMLNGKEGG